jgi:hypothetical protein
MIPFDLSRQAVIPKRLVEQKYPGIWKAISTGLPEEDSIQIPGYIFLK